MDDFVAEKVEGCIGLWDGKMDLDYFLSLIE